MLINKSSAKFSKIVTISQKLQTLISETGAEYLLLNRGVNAVTNLNVDTIIPKIDFNSNLIQVYPHNTGYEGLRNAINFEYFQGQSNINNITIVAGGMNGLDLVTQVLNIHKLAVPSYFWGAYANIARIRGCSLSTYNDLGTLEIKKLKGAAVVLCDPSNPLGSKQEDKSLLEVINMLCAGNIPVIFDSPYRKLFTGRFDSFFQKLLSFPNVVMVESFSKSMGLSGQRIGFVHSQLEEFNKELQTRALYTNNGVNAFAQKLVQLLLNDKDGICAVEHFRNVTTKDIKLNIEFLIQQNLLASNFYKNNAPMGIFVVVNKTTTELLAKNIGSVGLDFFTIDSKKFASNYSRICVSVPHKKFKKFFNLVK